MQNDDELRKRYNAFFKRCLSSTRDIYFGLRDAGILSASDEELRALALNSWILVTSWFDFIHSNLLVEEGQEELRELLNAGIYQIFAMERPYLTDAFREPVAELAEQLGKSLEQIVALP